MNYEAKVNKIESERIANIEKAYLSFHAKRAGVIKQACDEIDHIEKCIKKRSKIAHLVTTVLKKVSFGISISFAFFANIVDIVGIFLIGLAISIARFGHRAFMGVIDAIWVKVAEKDDKGDERIEEIESFLEKM